MYLPIPFFKFIEIQIFQTDQKEEAAKEIEMVPVDKDIEKKEQEEEDKEKAGDDEKKGDDEGENKDKENEKADDSVEPLNAEEK